MTNLTFNEYQRRARETAVYEDPLYLPMALIGEVGELAEHIAKMHRGDYPEVDRDFCISELGDALWATAMIADELGISPRLDDNWFTEMYRPMSQFEHLDFEIEMVELARIAACCACQMVDSSINFINDMLKRIITMAGYFDAGFTEIAQANLHKLADRAERGMLRGEGDER